jgi:hemoglobin
MSSPHSFSRSGSSIFGTTSSAASDTIASRVLSPSPPTSPLAMVKSYFSLPSLPQLLRRSDSQDERGRSQQPPPHTLYQRLGGNDAMVSLVTSVYEKTIHDPRISRFFVMAADAHGMHQLRNRQCKFLSMLLGGPDGGDMVGISALHRPLVEKLGLRPEHFDVFISHFETCLEGMRLEHELVSRVVQKLQETKDQVCCLNDFA